MTKIVSRSAYIHIFTVIVTAIRSCNLSNLHISEPYKFRQQLLRKQSVSAERYFEIKPKQTSKTNLSLVH